MPITIQDIAKELGLHHSTVGYALTGKGTIREETRRLVQETARRMGYVSSQAARLTRTRQSPSVGVVMPNVVLGYGAFIQLFFQQGMERQRPVQIVLTEFTPERESAGIRLLLEAQVSGLILKSYCADWQRIAQGHPLRLAAENRVPVVGYGNVPEGSPFPAVRLDLREHGFLVGEHLHSRGHRHAALLLHHPLPVYGNARDLLAGIRQGMGDREVPVLTLEEQIVEGGREPGVNYHYRRLLDLLLHEQGAAVAEELVEKALALSPQPSALICQNDLLALHTLAHLQRRKIRVPQDLAVAATERSFASGLCPLTLTTAGVSPEEMADGAWKVLERTWAKPETPVGRLSLTVRPQLRVGASTIGT